MAHAGQKKGLGLEKLVQGDVQIRAPVFHTDTAVLVGEQDQVDGGPMGIQIHGHGGWQVP